MELKLTISQLYCVINISVHVIDYIALWPLVANMYAILCYFHLRTFIPNLECGVFLMYMCVSAKEKGEKKLFGFSFIPLMQENGRTLPDGIHELIVHKVFSKRSQKKHSLFRKKS